MNNQFYATNPATEEKIGPFPLMDFESLMELANHSRQAQRINQRLSIRERQYIVEKFIMIIRRKEDEVAREITIQMGKPIEQARNEINTMIFRAESILKQSENALATRSISGRQGLVRYVQKIPQGVVFNLVAWNYPLLIAVNVVLPAILAGNSIILKHSAKTPLCGKMFQDAFLAAGAPENLVSAVNCDHLVVEKFIQSDAVDFVSFTGSVSGGRSIKEAAGGRFINVGLELGGKDPAYVTQDLSDINKTAESLAEGFCYNCGQSCCAVERLYVHTKIYEEFVPLFAEHAKKYKPDNPLLDSTNMGPLISEKARSHLINQIEDALEKGATIALAGGPESIDGRGFFFRPQIMENVNHEMNLMKEENFGPIIGIMRVENDAEALELMNDSVFGLTASIWGYDEKRIEHLLLELDAGTLFMNRCDYLDPDLPWSGSKNSGIGSTLGMEGFWQLTRPRTVYMQSDRL